MKPANTVVGTIRINDKKHQVVKRGDCKDSYFVRFKKKIVGGVVNEQGRFVPVGKNHAVLPLVDYPVTHTVSAVIHEGIDLPKEDYVEEPAR